jgi:hypothetical protein
MLARQVLYCLSHSPSPSTGLNSLCDNFHKRKRPVALTWGWVVQFWSAGEMTGTGELKGFFIISPWLRGLSAGTAGLLQKLCRKYPCLGLRGLPYLLESLRPPF